MTAKNVLMPPEGLRPGARASTCPLCYTTGCSFILIFAALSSATPTLKCERALYGNFFV